MSWERCFVEVYGEEAAQEWLPRLRERVQAAAALLQGVPADAESQHVILIAYPDQFYDGEEKKLKVFERFAEKYLEGVFDTVHFLPFCPYSSDDGFSVTDYLKIREDLGDWEDLKRIAGHFTLMYDFVCNHVSAESGWFQKCLSGEPAYEKFFMEMTGREELSKVIRPRTTPLLTRFHTAKGERYYWTTFSADQVDLNYHNPQVFWEAANVFLSYLERGGRWIRMDAAGFLWKEPGSTCMHLKNTHSLIKLFRGMMEEVYPGGRIVTETNVPHRENVSYFGNGTDESNMVYQFPLPMLVLYSFFRQNAAVLSQWAAGLSLPSGKTSFLNFLASHDGIGVNPVRSLLPEEEIDALIQHLEDKAGALVSYKENADGTESPYEINVTYYSALQEKYDFETAKRRYLNAHSVLLGMQGDAAVYVNSYLGMENDAEGVRRTGVKRSINREKFACAALLEELEREESRQAKIRRELEFLIRVRKGCDAFDAHAEQRVLRDQEELFAYMRIGRTRKVLCLHNFSGRRMEREDTAGVDLLTGEKVDGRLLIEPFGFRWIEV